MKITRKAFRAWLAEQPPRRVVGAAGRPWHCPAAHYLNTCGFSDAMVGRSIFWRDGRRREQERATPGWMVRFVRAVDDAGLYRRITAGRALKILDGIE